MNCQIVQFTIIHLFCHHGVQEDGSLVLLDGLAIGLQAGERAARRREEQIEVQAY